MATAPDGKIYRVGPNGKTEEFYDPKQKYIWSMLCDPAGNLYIATGDQGEVHKVTPDGKGAVFFKTDETHARSMALDHDGQSDRRHRARRPCDPCVSQGRRFCSLSDVQSAK